MSGELTFLLADVQDSTRLWEESPDEMAVALARHDEIIHLAVSRFGGEHKAARGEGDSHFAVFDSPRSAVDCALAIQRELAGELWPEKAEISVRIGIHTGPVEQRGGDYYGPTVNRAARLRSIAHGGQTVLSSAVTEAGGAPPADFSLRDRGHHRLKDLEEPLHVFELCHPELRADFPPLMSLDGVRHNLPIQLTSFIGRDEEIAMVTKLLVEGGRLVSLAGSGGIGKTRLSLQVAAELVDSYPEGVWLVELSNVTDPGLVAREALSALGAPAHSDVLTDLVAFLSDRRALLVFDNCEQVVAGAAEVAEAILRECSGIVILTTTREPLGIAGEKIIRMAGMSLPDDEQDRLAEMFPGVQLFLDRAQAVEPTFVVDEQSRSSVIRICQRLDGLPLAIELAAARVGVLSPRQIDDRLNDRFALLTGGPRTRDARQRTMRAAIDWSHELLRADEAVLFRRLSVFVGGCTLAAAERVCASSPLAASAVIDLLSGLVDKSLLVVDQNSDCPRYRMLESISVYARERLEKAGETPSLRAAHLSWFVETTRRQAAGENMDSAVATIAGFRAEADNIRAALDHAAVTKPKSGLHLLWNTMDAWDMWANSSEGLARLESLLAIHPAPDAARLYGLSMLGLLAPKHGRLELARNAVVEAVDIARERSHEERLVANLVMLAELANLDGAVQEAETALSEAEAIARASDNRQTLAQVLTGMGRFWTERDLARSAHLLEEALRLRRELGESHHVGTLLGNLVSVYARQGRLQEARVAAREAKEIAAAAEDEDAVIALTMSLGRIALDEGDFADAEAMFREILEFAEARGLPNEAGFAWALLGESSRAVDDLPLAKERYTRSIREFEHAGNVVSVAFLSANLGHIALIEGALVEARRLATVALETARKAEIESATVEALELFAEIDASAGEHQRALRLFGAAEGLREQVGNARDLVDQNDYDAAVETARAAVGPEEAARIWAAGREEGADALAVEVLSG